MGTKDQAVLEELKNIRKDIQELHKEVKFLKKRVTSSQEVVEDIVKKKTTRLEKKIENLNKEVREICSQGTDSSTDIENPFEELRGFGFKAHSVEEVSVCTYVYAVAYFQCSVFQTI